MVSRLARGGLQRERESTRQGIVQQFPNPLPQPGSMGGFVQHPCRVHRTRQYGPPGPPGPTDILIRTPCRERKGKRRGVEIVSPLEDNSGLEPASKPCATDWAMSHARSTAAKKSSQPVLGTKKPADKELSPDNLACARSSSPISQTQ